MHLVANRILNPDPFDPNEYAHRIVVLAGDYISGTKKQQLMGISVFSFYNKSIKILLPNFFSSQIMTLNVYSPPPPHSPYENLTGA